MLHNKHLLVVIRVLQVMIFINLVGCAQVATRQDRNVNKPIDSPSVAVGKSWWYYRVKVNWPDNASPNWMMDTLVAGEIFSPVLDRYRDDIELWRFHRRAGRDSAGHLFSLIFYSTASSAQLIYADLNNNELMLELLQDGHLDGVSFDDVTQLQRPDREDTSDKTWPLVIQKSWPDYIMGVSQMWLNIVKTLSKNNAHLDLLDRYELIQNEVTSLWMENGQHVWLHHLNALYAYQPLLIRY